MAAVETTLPQVFARVAVRTGLCGEEFHRKRSLAPLVAALCGIRGDRLDAAHLALAARLPDYEPSALLQALQEKKTLARTWGVRGLLQVVPRDRLSSYLAAAGITAPRWRRFLDARSNLSTTARLRLLKRLCPEVISREALRESIPDANTRQFMLREAAQEGYIVWRDGDGPQATFAWAREWLDEKVEHRYDYQDLIGEYIASYGPVDAPDLAVWLGVTVAAARKLVAKHHVDEIRVEGEPVSTFMRTEDVDELRSMRKSHTKGIVVVPPGDPLLLAYKSRFQPDGGEAERGVAFQDGRVVATWALAKGEASVRFTDQGDRKGILEAIRSLLARAEIGEPITTVEA